MWFEGTKVAEAGIKSKSFVFTENSKVTTTRTFECPFDGTPIAISIIGEAYNASGNRDVNYDTALVWHRDVEGKALARSGTSYGASTVPTNAFGNNPTIATLDDGRIVFRSGMNSYARAVYKATVYYT